MMLFTGTNYRSAHEFALARPTIGQIEIAFTRGDGESDVIIRPIHTITVHTLPEQKNTNQ